MDILRTIDAANEKVLAKMRSLVAGYGCRAVCIACFRARSTRMQALTRPYTISAVSVPLPERLVWCRPADTLKVLAEEKVIESLEAYVDKQAVLDRFKEDVLGIAGLLESLTTFNDMLVAIDSPYGNPQHGAQARALMHLLHEPIPSAEALLRSERESFVQRLKAQVLKLNVALKEIRMEMASGDFVNANADANRNLARLESANKQLLELSDTADTLLHQQRTLGVLEDAKSWVKPTKETVDCTRNVWILNRRWKQMISKFARAHIKATDIQIQLRAGARFFEKDSIWNLFDEFGADLSALRGREAKHDLVPIMRCEHTEWASRMPLLATLALEYVLEHDIVDVVKQLGSDSTPFAEVSVGHLLQHDVLQHAVFINELEVRALKEFQLKNRLSAVLAYWRGLKLKVEEPGWNTFPMLVGLPELLRQCRLHVRTLEGLPSWNSVEFSFRQVRSCGRVVVLHLGVGPPCLRHF